MSTENNAINQRSLAFQVGSSTTTNNLDIQRSGSGLWIDMDDQTDNFGYYNFAGNPNNNVTANIGSLCVDTTNGALYVKQTDASNTGWVISAGGTGQLVQSVSATSATHQTSTVGVALIPSDDTIPQQTEGVEHITLAITPTNASNILRIRYDMLVGTNAVQQTIKTCLFQDATANALYTTTITNSTALLATYSISGSYEMTAGTTSSTTFKIRFGTDAGSGQAAVNGLSTGRLYGGSSITLFTIDELLP